MTKAILSLRMIPKKDLNCSLPDSEVISWIIRFLASSNFVERVPGSSYSMSTCVKSASLLVLMMREYSWVVTDSPKAAARVSMSSTARVLNSSLGQSAILLR